MTVLDSEMNICPSKIKQTPQDSSVHLVGIGGVAMAPLAGLLKEAGCQVTGSDGDIYPPVSDMLAEMGLNPAKGYGPETLPTESDLVVIGNVVTKNFPVLERLATLKKPYLSLPQTLGQIFLSETRNLVVAGCHGKTTTTAMAARIWDTARLNPGFLIGGASLDFPKPWRRAKDSAGTLGEKPWFIIEGDEYDSAFFNKVPKFLHYRPHTVILTSIEFDHADIYPDLRAVENAFSELVNIIPAEGQLIANGDDPLVVKVASQARCRVEFYGTGQDNQWRITGFEPEGWGSSFELSGPDGFYVRLSLNRPGLYNALNGAAAAAAFVGSGGEGRVAAQALASFKGPKRRQEIVGVFNNIELIDDFAHHPTAVRETIRAVRQARPGSRILAAFEPRSNTSRRAVFQNDYVQALAGSDLIFLRQTADPSKAPEGNRLDVDRLAADLAPKARVFQSGQELGQALVAAAAPGDVVVVMSNGDFDGLTKFLGKQLGQPRADC